MAAELGMSAAQAKREIREDTRSRNKWKRKRDRRFSYEGRRWRLEETQGKSLKRAALEVKVANDMSRVMDRFGDE
jgi:hypothetical protein